MNDTYLAHHGIKGQKWGVRRFQNPDGTLTEEGRAKYLKGMNRKEKDEYIQSDEGTRRAVEKYMDQGLPYSEASQKVKEEDRDRTRKIVAAGAITVGAILAAYGGYKLYKHLGKEAVNARNFQLNAGNRFADAVAQRGSMTDHWDKSDIEGLQELARRQAKERADAVTRGSVLKGKLGIGSKADKAREWRQTYEYQNYVNAANKRGELNRQIANQRENLATMERQKNVYLIGRTDDARRAGLDRAYDKERYASIYEEANHARYRSLDHQIEMGKQTLEDLLKRKKLMAA